MQIPHAPRDVTRFVEMCLHRAEAFGDTEAFLFADEAVLKALDTRQERQSPGMDYATLDRRVRAVAARLQQHSKPGDRVVILEAPGLDFVVAWLACLYAEVVAVPLYPPDPARFARTLPRFQSVVVDAAPTVLLTNPGFASLRALLLPVATGLGDIEFVVTSTVPDEAAGDWRPTFPDAEAPAMLQYTSGSTGTPKGVILTHGSLLHNLAAINEAWGHTRQTRQVSWLPPYHDLGLMAGILTPLYCVYPTMLMSPLAFLQKPVRWLRAIEWYKATASGGPNFAYTLTAKKFRPEVDGPLDLSSWQIGINGAEPIRGETLETFHKTFAPYGLRSDVIRPCYGLAEATLMVSGGGTQPAAVRWVDRIALEQARRVRERPVGDARSREVVGCGPVAPGIDVRIVDPATRLECGFDQVGEIWIAGGSVAAGYWGQPEKTDDAFHATLADTGEGPFLRSGDLGFLLRGELFITGRVKDLIIVRGRNHYPEDIEHTVGDAHPAFRPGSTAAFQVGEAGEERLIVLQEIRKSHLRGFDGDAAFAEVAALVSDRHGVRLDELVFLEPRGLIKTSSGKISRSSNRTAWEDEKLLAVASCSSAATTAVTALRTETEVALAAVWAELLEVSVADRTASFSALGGDSIAVVELSSRIAERWGKPISPASLLDRPRLCDVAALIDGNELAPPRDLDEEIWIDITAEDIAQARPHEGEHRTLLLTGGNGFVGVHLLHTLLQDPALEIVALVRAADPAAGRERLRAAMAHHALPADGLDERVEVLTGDLSQPRFGLTGDAFQQLAARTDAVYHCGAYVDWLQPYAVLRGANVDGTREVINFCVAGGRISKLHYISTMWVINPQPGDSLDESHRSRWQGLKTGYSESKWVAENLVHAAHALGLPMTAHRAELILPSAANGIGPRTDFVTRTYREFVRQRVIPSEAAPMFMIAVDWLCEAMVTISKHPESSGVYHYPWSRPRFLTELAEDLDALGYDMEHVPYDEWRERIAAHRDSALYPLRFFIKMYSSWRLNNVIPILDERTRAWLKAIAPELAASHPKQRVLLRRTLQALYDEGLIEQPPRQEPS